MKIALYKMMYGEGRYSTECVFIYRDGEKDSSDAVRVSEPVEVEFPPLKDEEVIAAQLNACDEKEKEIRMRFQQALDHLNDERARIQALPNLATT